METELGPHPCAQCWSQRRTVHRPEIDKFIGTLTRQRARKGVFITTSDFYMGARDGTRPGYQGCIDRWCRARPAYGPGTTWA
nr:restriction endonuclease [Pseudomonas syringae]